MKDELIFHEYGCNRRRNENSTHIGLAFGQVH